MKSYYEFSARMKSLAALGLVAVIVAGCVTKANDRGETPVSNAATAPTGTPVDAVILRPSEVTEVLNITGTLVANQQVEIVSELTRKIVTVNVKEGSKVKRGTLLFQLDDADLRAQLQRLRQQEKLAVLNEQRLKDLLEHDAVAQQDYDEASTNLSVLQAQIQELLVTIDKTQIRAPFDGQVGIVNVHRGAIVSLNTVLTDIEDNSVVKVEFALPEKYAGLVPRGSEHKFTTVTNNREYTAKVSALGAKVSQNTRTLVVRATTPNPNGELLPGQSAKLHLSLNTLGNSLAVSSNALIPSSKGYTVYVARKNQAQAVPVEIGQRSAGSVQILSGLQAGDTVITSNLLRLGPGSPVQFATLN